LVYQALHSLPSRTLQANEGNPLMERKDLGQQHRGCKEYEGFQVRLESVKRLGEFLEQTGGFSPQMGAQKNSSILCSDLVLPSNLQPSCENYQTARIFRDPCTITQEDCKICVNVTCTGCY
uniref:Guanylate cyclase activator 2B n=1 Tax=Vombatus ursinus TaxID=29139 RepID=A0A4X2JU59_VOMUR